jgi:predicted nucleic acid-binding protein
MLSYVNEEPGRVNDVDALLGEASRGQIVIITSVLSVAEVAFSAAERTGKALDPVAEAKIDKLWAPVGPIRLVEFHVLIAEKAKALRRSGLSVPDMPRLTSVDAMHLATAQHEKVLVCHTYEPRLTKWAGLAGVAVSVPLPTQPTLGLPPA